MSRIRTIKPELLTDSNAAGLSDTAWRLWVSMWLDADDCGCLPADPDLLAGRVFWKQKERPQVPELLLELTNAKLVKLYTVRGSQYAHIVNWQKHQKINRPSGPRFPTPEEAIHGALTEPSVSPHAILGEPSNKKLNGTVVVGVEVEGSDRDRDPDQTPAPVQVLNELNRQRKAAVPGSRAIRATPENLKHISERLKAGATVEDCAHVIAVCAAEAQKDPSTAKWFNTVSPFRPDNFQRKLGGTPHAIGAKGHGTYHGDHVEGDRTAELGDWEDVA